jgi:hypothetical protein
VGGSRGAGDSERRGPSWQTWADAAGGGPLRSPARSGGERRGGRRGVLGVLNGLYPGEWILASGNLQAPLTLAQKGLRVTGRYGHDGEYAIEGKVKGCTLAFEVTEPSGKSTGTAELWEDGEHLLGELKVGSEKLLFAAYRRATRPAPPQPGAVSEGQSEAGLRYVLRVPSSYDATQRYPLVVVTHGSNTSSRGYVETATVLYYPDLFDVAFPMSFNLLPARLREAEGGAQRSRERVVPGGAERAR